MWVLSHARRKGSERWCPECMYLTPFSSQFPFRIHPVCTDGTWSVCFWLWDFLKCLKECRCRGTKLPGVPLQACPLPADGGRSQRREVSCCSFWSLEWVSILFKSAELRVPARGAEWHFPLYGDRGYLCPRAPESLAVVQQRAAACCSDYGKSCWVVHCPPATIVAQGPCSLCEQCRNYNHKPGEVTVILVQEWILVFGCTFELLKIHLHGSYSDHKIRIAGAVVWYWDILKFSNDFLIWFRMNKLNN